MFDGPPPVVSVASKKRKKKRRRKRKPTEEGELAAKSRGSKFTGALAEHLLKLAPDAHRKRKRDDGDCSPNKRMRSESGEPLENDAQSSGESALSILACAASCVVLLAACDIQCT